MKPFDDMLPEEKEPQHRELATLLRRAYRRPVPVPAPEQGQIIARVRERLVRANAGASSAEEMPLPQTGVLDPPPLQAASPVAERGRRMRPFRFMALFAAALIIVVLIGTPLLLLGPRLLTAGGNAAKTPGGSPTLVLSQTTASIGSTIQLTLKHFPPNTHVALTHDDREPIPLEGGSSIISVGPSGSVTADVSIGSDWALGFDQIYAEDLSTHYVVSAQLQVIRKGSAQTYDSFVAAYGIMFGFDAQHTNFNPFEDKLNPANVGGLTKKWAYQAEGTLFSSPAVAGGVVYIGCACGYLYAIDAATGAKKWSYWAGGSQFNDSPAVVDGVVYFGSSEDHTLYALDAVTGKKKWAYQTRGAIVSSPAVVGGMVYVGSDDGNVYALDAASGARKWMYSTGDYVDSSPAVADGVVYVGSETGNVYALDAASGVRKWAHQTGDVVYSSPAVANGVVYVGSQDGNIYALDAASGTKKWAYQTGIRVEASPAVADGMVYIGSVDNGTLYALDAASGTKRWAYRSHGQMFSPPMVANGVVYVGFNNGGNVYALDATSGTMKWTYQIGGTDSSAAVADGMVYVSSLNGLLYAFHLPGS